MYDLSCFKAYDIRGKYPYPLSETLAFALGNAVCSVLGARKVIIGFDARLSGESLATSLCSGLACSGARVESLGMCGTEEIYHAVANGVDAADNAPFDAGIMITGSHNPADENGFKLVRSGAVPVSSDSGLLEIKKEVEKLLQKESLNLFNNDSQHLVPPNVRYRQDYLDWLVNYSNIASCSFVRPLKIVADAGNGCAGLVLSHLQEKLPFEFVCNQMNPDGNFPAGVPNPLLPEKRETTSGLVRQHKADFGIAWDGDFDRCFFYDNEGNFVEGYYLVGLLATELLRQFPGEKIIHDTRVYWNTREQVLASGGIPIISKTGHAFIKERMRFENAVYGGEMSAHHYFRDFAYCDSGMLPWLLLACMLGRSGASMKELLEDRIRAFPCSGEINRRVSDPKAAICAIVDKYKKYAIDQDRIDGINMEFREWRFNLRMSNTEPLLRLNVESRANPQLLQDRTAEILSILEAFCVS